MVKTTKRPPSPPAAVNIAVEPEPEFDAEVIISIPVRGTTARLAYLTSLFYARIHQTDGQMAQWMGDELWPGVPDARGHLIRSESKELIRTLTAAGVQ